jgi:molybdopterin synthase sulfur carrier subunit
MEIELHLYASLKRDLPVKGDGTSRRIDVDQGTTIEDLLDRLSIPADTVRIILLNGVHAGGGRVLKDGDRLGVFPPLAGG